MEFRKETPHDRALQPNQNDSDFSAKTIAISIAGGVALGTPIWLALDNLGAGVGVAIAAGIAISVALGAALNARKSDNDG